VDFDLGEAYQREGSYKVEVVTIDDFVKKNSLKIGLLKIDAEGVEMEVLNGARDTFLQHRPVAILGLHPFAYTNRAITLSLIWDKLKEYKLRVLMNGKDITKEEFCAKKEMVYDVELLPE